MLFCAANWYFCTLTWGTIFLSKSPLRRYVVVFGTDSLKEYYFIGDRRLMNISLEIARKRIFFLDTYIFGPLHDNSHDIDPNSMFPFACSVCGHATKETTIMFDLYSLSVSLTRSFYAGVYRYMVKNQIGMISDEDLIYLVRRKGICNPTDMEVVNAAVDKIRCRLAFSHDPSQHDFTQSKTNRGECLCGWIGDQQLRAFSENYLRDSLLERHQLVNGCTIAPLPVTVQVALSESPFRLSNGFHLS